MIDISKLYCGTTSSGDSLRYVQEPLEKKRPVIVWSVTKQCNLKCAHCYTDSNERANQGELTTQEGLQLIDQLADYGVPVILFSGGEPLTRSDLFTLMEYAARKNIRPVLSTNGLLLDRTTARACKDAGTVYVGISLDGLEATNDRFRGMKGAFAKAMEGFSHCQAVGQHVGLRFTLTRQNYHDIEAIFSFIEQNRINRACFYHLVYSGRGKELWKQDLSHQETRAVLDTILQYTRSYYEKRLDIHILTVDNHVDGVYVYKKLQQEHSSRAGQVYELLSMNGGALSSTGVGIGNIDFYGNVHPDQFWQDYTLGNIKEQSFAHIWHDTSDLLLKGLKQKTDFLKGRCRFCRYQQLCGGGLRVRAYRVFQDPWAPDPQCYLTDEEIGLTGNQRKFLQECGESFELPATLEG